MNPSIYLSCRRFVFFLEGIFLTEIQTENFILHLTWMKVFFVDMVWCFTSLESWRRWWYEEMIDWCLGFDHLVWSQVIFSHWYWCQTFEDQRTFLVLFPHFLFYSVIFVKIAKFWGDSINISITTWEKGKVSRCHFIECHYKMSHNGKLFWGKVSLRMVIWDLLM